MVVAGKSVAELETGTALQLQDLGAACVLVLLLNPLGLLSEHAGGDLALEDVASIAIPLVQLAPELWLPLSYSKLRLLDPLV